MTVEDLLPLWPSSLWKVLDEGHRFDIGALDDCEYHGISLGQPGWVSRLTWVKFKKVFLRDPESGALRGWNVRCEQTPLDEPWTDRRRGDVRMTWGHYGVYEDQQGVTIDYGWQARGLNPQRLVKDPLRAVNAGNADLLIGVSRVDLGLCLVGTPTYFALIRGGPLQYAVQP